MLIPTVILAVGGRWHYPSETSVSVQSASETHVVKGGTRHFSWKCRDTTTWEVQVPNTFRPELTVQVYQHQGPWDHMTATLEPSRVHPNTSATIVPCPYRSRVDPHLAVALSAVAKYGPQACTPGTTLELHVSADGPYLIHFGPQDAGHNIGQAAYNYFMVGSWANIRSPILSFVGTLAIVYALRAHTLLHSSEKSDWEQITETILVLVWFSGLTTDMTRYGEAVTIPECTPLLKLAAQPGHSTNGSCPLCILLIRIAAGAAGMTIPLWGRRGDWSKMIATILVIPAIFLGVGYVVAPVLTVVWVNFYTYIPPGTAPVRHKTPRANKPVVTTPK